MNWKTLRSFTLVVFCVVLVCGSLHAAGLRSIGLRVALSWSETPVWLGIEASTDLSWSVLSGAFFVTPNGKTLLTGSLDVPMQPDRIAFVRLTGGFYYFDDRQMLPYPLAGVGLSYLPVAQSPVYFGFAGEFIYPLAFPLPMFSISGGWFL